MYIYNIVINRYIQETHAHTVDIGLLHKHNSLLVLHELLTQNTKHLGRRKNKFHKNVNSIVKYQHIAAKSLGLKTGTASILHNIILAGIIRY